jgi:hypothetical protein
LQDMWDVCQRNSSCSEGGVLMSAKKISFLASKRVRERVRVRKPAKSVSLSKEIFSKHDSWLKERTTITLTRKEMFDLSTSITIASRSDVEFTKIRDRRMRRMFRDEIDKRHKLWLKITHCAQRGV